MRKFEYKPAYPFFRSERVQRLTSIVASINFWASSPERFSILSICLPSENIVMSRRMRSSAERVWPMNRFKAGKFERSVTSQKGRGELSREHVWCIYPPCVLSSLCGELEQCTVEGDRVHDVPRVVPCVPWPPFLSSRVRGPFVYFPSVIESE